MREDCSRFQPVAGEVRAPLLPALVPREEEQVLKPIAPAALALRALTAPALVHPGVNAPWSFMAGLSHSFLGFDGILAAGAAGIDNAAGARR